MKYFLVTSLGLSFSLLSLGAYAQTLNLEKLIQEATSKNSELKSVKHITNAQKNKCTPVFNLVRQL